MSLFVKSHKTVLLDLFNFYAKEATFLMFQLKLYLKISENLFILPANIYLTT